MKPWEETWHVDRPDGENIENQDGSTVFLSMKTPEDGRSKWPERAHLAAASPELYRALERCNEVLESKLDEYEGQPPHFGETLIKERVLEALAALRKARGEAT